MWWELSKKDWNSKLDSVHLYRVHFFWWPYLLLFKYWASNFRLRNHTFHKMFEIGWNFILALSFINVYSTYVFALARLTWSYHLFLFYGCSQIFFMSLQSGFYSIWQSMTCNLFWVAAAATPEPKIPPHPQPRATCFFDGRNLQPQAQLYYKMKEYE